MRTEDVFKQTGFPEYTYAERWRYDAIFKNALKDGGVHIYLYGNSKAGKTSMWKKYIDSEKHIEIKIASEMKLENFYYELLERIDPFYLKDYTEVTGSESKIGGTAEAGFKIAKVGGKAENVDTNSTDTQYERLFKPEIGLTFVTNKAKEAQKVIILEDFQMASDNFIKELASVLKAFADDQVKVIIVGIDNKTSNILNARSDIGNRINTVNLDKFTKEELLDIISKGEGALKIDLSDEVKEFIVGNSFERAYLLQGICRYLCAVEEIEETQRRNKKIEDIESVKKACQLLAIAVEGTYEKSFLNISRAGTNANKNDTYRWILRALRDGLKIGNEGIEAKNIAQKIRELAGDFNTASIYPCLKNMISKQDIGIFRYEDQRLYVDDIMFLFYLRWCDSICDELEVQNG